MSERFTAWVTKYALTDGIRQMQVEDCFSTADGMVQKVSGRNEFYHGRDWHRSHEAAIERAEEMRTKKIASLKKSIDKFEKLSFRGAKS